MHITSKWSIHQNHRDVLAQILDRNLLTATPETSLGEVIRLLSSVSSLQCELTAQGAGICLTSSPEPMSRAVVIQSGDAVQGIFTERDLVRLAPQGKLSREQVIGSLICADFIALKLSEFQDFFSLVHLMRQHQIQYLPILDESAQVMGFASLERIRQLLQPSDLLKLRLLHEVLEPTVICAPPEATLQTITCQMAEARVSCVVIVESGAAHAALEETGAAHPCPVGIITERDILQFQFLELDLYTTQAAQVMSAPLFVMHPNESVWRAHQVMLQRRVRRLVVVNESGGLAGIITLSRLLNILEPAEMFSLLEVLQEQILSLQQEKENLLQEKAAALEKEMESHLKVRLLTQEMLQDMERSYQVLVTNLPAGVYRLFPYPEPRMIFLNDYLVQLTGFSPDELEMGEVCSLCNLILPDDQADVIKTVKDAMAHGESFELHYRIQDKSGQVRYLWEQAQPIMGTGDELSHYDGVIFDLTARHKFEQALHTERDFNAAILETVRALVLVLNPQGEIIRFNAACASLTGYTLEELQHAPIWDTLIPADEMAATQAVFQQILQGEYPNHHQNHWLDKAGNRHLISWTNTALTDDQGRITHIVATGLDKSETQQLEKQFLRVQRLESIGTLASGIAHDLNNILTPILAISQLLPLKIPDLDPENQHLLEMMKESAKRGSALVSQVLTFSRGMEGDRTHLQIRHIIAEIRSIAMQTFPKFIAISVDTPRDLWQIYGDPTQLHQVMMNLCVNARDAMRTGGQLSISAVNLQIDQDFAEKNLEAKVGPYILITVSDTGCGISEENLEKIFEPFFTTKAPRQGTGLGLSTVHGIIKNHNGFMTVQSEIGKGSQFRIYLPAIQSNSPNLEVREDLPRGNGELILLVDDEAPIREIARELLETYHYRVETASDGIEAIATYAQNPSEIKLVLMDMDMPSMDGITAIQTLQKINPEISIVLTSGLASNEKLVSTLGKGVKAFAPKPYSTDRLLEVVSTALIRSSSS